jgi:hypothetical protein
MDPSDRKRKTSGTGRLPREFDLRAIKEDPNREMLSQYARRFELQLARRDVEQVWRVVKEAIAEVIRIDGGFIGGDVLDIPMVVALGDTGMAVRISNALEQYLGIVTVEGLRQFGPTAVGNVNNLGKGAVERITKALDALGLEWTDAGLCSFQKSARHST